MPVNQYPAAEAFSTQSAHFDADDEINPVLQKWRQRIYRHVAQYMSPTATILELNAGTGIDAVHFARAGHVVHATDIADGMIERVNAKARLAGLANLTVQQVSFDNLDRVDGTFDYVFSNFGGLNCIQNLRDVTRHLSARLHRGSFVTWVIMPRVCPWEWLRLLGGHWKEASRRFSRAGAIAHVDGSHFTTWYHSMTDIRQAFGDSFRLISCEGIGVISPPPASTRFLTHFPKLSSVLETIDTRIGRLFPCNRWGDHVIVTFQFTGS